MKIVFLNVYQDKVSRGAETFVSELSKRLSKNHQVDVLTSVNYIDLLKSDYDVFIPTNGRWQALLVRLISWIKGKKMIISGQSGVGFDDRINLYCFPDYFVALSTYALEKSKSRNPFVKCVYIPNGVDLKKFYPGSSKKQREKIVLSVGAFTKEKRHDLTIKAVSKLTDAKLVVVGGGGDLKEKIQSLGEKLLGSERFEIKSVKHDEMPEIYRNADVLAFPTVAWESFGIVIVEAMASGIPVVATDDPIRREIVGDGGLVVDPTETNEYAKTIKMALRTKWANRPRKQAEKFDWDNIAKKYEEYINLCKIIFV